MQKFILLGLFLLGLLSACATPVTVNSDYPEDIRFEQYQAYRWQDSANLNTSTDAFLASEFVDGRIHANVDTELRTKGYSYRAQGPVDFLVSYTLSSEPREDLRSYGGYYDPWWSIGLFHHHRSMGYGVGISDAPRLAVDHYLHASLMLDFVDAQTGQLIWRSRGELRVPDEQSGEKRRAILERVVTKALKDFPSRLK